VEFRGLRAQKAGIQSQQCFSIVTACCVQISNYTVPKMSEVIILDGGMSRELMRLDAPFRQPEWSALALMDAPQLVEQVHVEFAAAGAQVLTTDSYALVPFHIGEERFFQHGEKLAADAGRLARKAADAAGKVVVAGSLPPLFGSYEPDKFQPSIAPKYIDILVRGLSPYVDAWLGETLSLIAEAEVVLTATKGSNKPVWIAFTLNEPDGSPPSLRSGELVKDAARWALQSGIKALLFNCCRPEVRVAKQVVGESVRIGAYANSFEPKPKMHQANEVVSGIREDLNPAQYGEYVNRWIESGANIVGGCCGIGCEHIRLLAAAFKDRRADVEEILR
jgi:S-methylmethionine-dependent homocysteine/selenocysteine methylase